MGGIEPPSESACSRLSPGAVGYLTAGGCPSPSRSKPTRLPGRVASLCMVRSKLCARTDAADRRPGPGPQRSRAGRACLKRRPERSCRSQLLFKVPVFKDGRGIRPLITHPHPRRNHCIPILHRNFITFFQKSQHCKQRFQTLLFPYLYYFIQQKIPSFYKTVRRDPKLFRYIW